MMKRKVVFVFSLSSWDLRDPGVLRFDDTKMGLRVAG